MKRNCYKDKIFRTSFGDGVISLERVRKIMKEEGIDYNDEELAEILAFVSEIVSITTSHFQRMKKS